MTDVCAGPLSLEELIAYVLEQPPELGEADRERIESHYFACPSCTRRLETVMQLRQGIVDVVSRGRVSASVTPELVARGTAGGLRVRNYTVHPGQSVACTAAPDDDFVAIRLGLDAPEAETVDVAVRWLSLDDGATDDRQLSEVTFDPRTGEIVLLFSGAEVWQYPKSRWTMDAVVRDASGERRVGPYVLEHTPWERLEHPP